MFGSHKNRRNLYGTPRALARVEELEPRTLLATSPLASVLAPLTSPLALFGTAPALSPSAAPVTPPTPVSAVTPPGPTAGSQPPAPVTGGAAPSGNLTTLPGGSSASTPTPVLPVTPVAQPVPAAQTPSGVLPGALGTAEPNPASFPATTAAPANAGTPGTNAVPAGVTTPTTTGTALTPTSTNNLNGVVAGPNAVAPGATPGAAGVGTESPVATAVVTFLGLPGPVGVSVAQPFLALPVLGPGPTVTTPNAATDAPQFFDPATHRLLFVVGGPQDSSADDENEYDDRAIQPAPNAPLPGAEGVRPQAPERLPEAQPDDDAWACVWERYFAEDFLAVARGVDGLPSLGAVEGAGVGATCPEARPNPAAFPELLSAVAGLGLWHGLRQYEDEREPLPRRRRPAVVPIGPR